MTSLWTEINCSAAVSQRQTVPPPPPATHLLHGSNAVCVHTKRVFRTPRLSGAVMRVDAVFPSNRTRPTRQLSHREVTPTGHLSDPPVWTPERPWAWSSQETCLLPVGKKKRNSEQPAWHHEKKNTTKNNSMTQLHHCDEPHQGVYLAKCSEYWHAIGWLNICVKQEAEQMRLIKW